MTCTNCQIEFEPVMLIGGICHPCTLWRANRATETLRLVFYHRHALGTKVEEEIALEDLELWQQCHRILNPYHNPNCDISNA